MKSKVVPLRLTEQLLELAAVCAQEQRTDKATTLRRWLYRGAEEHALRLVEEGRLGVSRAAELLDLTLYDLYLLAEQRGIRLGATDEQYGSAVRERLRNE